MTKSDREIMEIFEAYDLTGTVWSAATLTGHDPKTVKRYVEARAGGRNPYEREPRPKMIDTFLEKVEEWVEQSKATIRADVVHEKLVKMGYRGSARSTRRAVNASKTAWKAGTRRTYRPWIPEPGRWLQFDWGEGPRISGRRTWLFCAWLSWSRFRVVIPVWDCTLGTLVACLDTQRPPTWASQWPLTVPFDAEFAIVGAGATLTAEEWIARLQPAPPTALHRLWEEEEVTMQDTFIDPATGIPVVKLDGKFCWEGGTEISFHSYAPRSLPAGSRITELIADDPAWVRTEDGILCPAPGRNTSGIAWDDMSARPTTLAALTAALLDDATHAVPGRPNEHLERLFQVHHQRGRRFPRQLLERVRAQGI